MWQARQENAARLASIERHVQRNTAGVSSDAAERSAPACDATYDFAPSYDVYRNDGFKVSDDRTRSRSTRRSSDLFSQHACVPACSACLRACLPPCVRSACQRRRLPAPVPICRPSVLAAAVASNRFRVYCHRAAAAAATVPAKFRCSTGVRPLPQVLCAIQRSQVRSEVLNALLFDIRKLLVRKRVDRRIAAIREKMEQSAAAGEVCLPARGPQ